MYEYRYGELAEEIIEKLADLGIYPIEETFKGEARCNVIYYDETLTEIIEDDYISRTLVEETGWEEKWKEFIKPGNLTDNLKYDFDIDKDVSSDTILINPSMAFGTGTHPTTRCAAELLEKVCEGRRVLDAGCGSGILAIAASKCGAEEVFAFDIDDIALVNTYENIKLNRVDNIHAWAGEIGGFRGDADVVVANIITSVLNYIHADVLALKPEFIVYSGILDSEYDDFMSQLDTSGYDIVESNGVEEWRGVLLKCQ